MKIVNPERFLVAAKSSMANKGIQAMNESGHRLPVSGNESVISKPASMGKNKRLLGVMSVRNFMKPNLRANFKM